MARYSISYKTACSGCGLYDEKRLSRDARREADEHCAATGHIVFVLYCHNHHDLWATYNTDDIAPRSTTKV